MRNSADQASPCGTYVSTIISIQRIPAHARNNATSLVPQFCTLIEVLNARPLQKSNATGTFNRIPYYENNLHNVKNSDFFHLLC